MTADAKNLLIRVSKNTGILAGASIIEKVFNFLLVVILVRYLSQEVFGRYGFISSYVLLFNVFIGLGLATLCTREISRQPDRAPRILTAALLPMIFSSFLTFLILVLSVFWTKPGQTDILIAVNLAALDLILSNFTAVFDAVPIANERMFFSVIPRVTRSALLLLLCFLFLPSGIGLVEVYCLVMLSGLIRLGMQVFFSKAVFDVMPALKFDKTLCKGMLKTAYPLALSSVFVIIYYKIDSVMLSYMRGDREVGLYTASSTLAFAALFIAMAFRQATYPVLAKLFISSRDQLLSVYRISIKYLAVAGLPIAFGLMVLAPQITVLVYKENYIDSSGALQILTIALLFMFVNGFMGNTLIAVDGQKSLMNIVGISALLNVGLNFLTIQRYGIAGAAAATVLAEVYAGVSLWIILSRRHGVTASLTDLIRPVICCGVMVSYVMLCSSLPLLLIIVSAAVLYFGLLFVTRTIGKEEMLLVRNLLGRKDIS